MRVLTALAALLLALVTVGVAPTAHTAEGPTWKGPAWEGDGTASASGQVSAPAGHSVEAFHVLAFIKRYSDTVPHYWTHVNTGYTDAAGRWRVDDLEAGEYLFEIRPTSSSELVKRFHGGQATPWTTPTTVVADGAHVTGIQTPLALGGTVEGTVRTVDGTPIEGIRVLAYEAVDVYGLGEPSWQLVQVGGTAPDGTYRVRRLREAPYRIAFLDPQERGYERVFHPGVEDLEDATTHQVRAGRATTGVDVRMSAGSAPEPDARAVHMLKAPTVKGKPRVGRVLRATTGRWEPGTVSVRHRWFVKRAGKVVGVTGARGAQPKLVLRKAHRGARVRVRMVVRAPGHESYVYTSRWTRRVRG